MCGNFKKDIYSSSPSIRQKILNAKRENSSYFICNFFCIHNLYIHSEINIAVEGVFYMPIRPSRVPVLTFTWRWGTIYRIMCFSYVCCALLILFFSSSSFRRTFLSFLSEKELKSTLVHLLPSAMRFLLLFLRETFLLSTMVKILEIAWRKNSFSVFPISENCSRQTFS